MPDSADDSATDPHRRVHRHHYQEGPGFLLLATQNGRPSRPRQRAGLGEVRGRMHVVRLALAQGVDSAVKELGVARRSVFPWLALSQYYNYHRLSGFLGWLTPAERFSGTPFTDRSSRTSRPG